MAFTTLFLDVGGVFLTNGWDHHMRERAAQHFNLDYKEMEARHALTFDTYEIGKISLDVYLNRAVFYEPRPFSIETFKEFMLAQSQAYPEMINLIREIKDQYRLKVVAVSNEGRELMEYRIQKFHLKEFVDVFICSAFVRMRKPDEEIYHLALDIAQVHPREVIYIDDRPLLAEIGRQLGFQAIWHTQIDQTHQRLIEFLSTSS